MPVVSSVLSLPALKVCKQSGCSGIATAYDGYCKECTSYRDLRSYNSRPSASRMKDPIGIELEMHQPSNLKYLTSITPYVCSDISLDGHEYAYSGEIKAVGSIQNILKKAADITQRARLAGNVVSSKCGFHVHCSLPSNFTGYSAVRYHVICQTTEGQNLVNFIKAIEPYFFDIMPPSRKNNKYCKSVTINSDLISGAFNHHGWFSFSKKVPTFEIRIHPGTTNPWKVMAWIEVCMKIREYVHSILNGNEIPNETWDTVKKFSDVMPMNSLGYRYLVARERSSILKKFVF